MIRKPKSVGTKPYLLVRVPLPLYDFFQEAVRRNIKTPCHALHLGKPDTLSRRIASTVLLSIEKEQVLTTVCEDPLRVLGRYTTKLVCDTYVVNLSLGDPEKVFQLKNSAYQANRSLTVEVYLRTVNSMSAQEIETMVSVVKEQERIADEKFRHMELLRRQSLEAAKPTAMARSFR